MHCDKKLGLGLGILLVGVVAALFFRHEGPPAPPSGELVDPERLDRAIADKDVSPYPDTAASARRDPGGHAAGPDSRAGAWALPEFLKETDLADAVSGGPAPNPIAADPPRARPGGANAGPEHNQAWRPSNPPTGTDREDAPPTSEPAGAPGSLSPGQASFRAPAGGNETVRHRVVPGDTLSGLAARYLGSSGRFLEIYEANRDVLRSPNDLRVGMTLRIPVRRDSTPVRPSGPATVRVSDTRPGVTRESATPAASPAVEQRDASEPSAAVSAAPPEPRLRFQPVSRSPLVPRAEHATPVRPGDPVPQAADAAGLPPVELLPLEEMFGEMPRSR